jgi:hypothetical protein
LNSPLGNEGFSMIHLRLFCRQYYSHNGNKFPSIPLAHAFHKKGTYENLQFLLHKLRYEESRWGIRAELKVIAMLTGL